MAENLYGASVPPTSNTDTATTGIYWSADVDGVCIGGRYYRGTGTPAGTGTLKLWTNGGSQLETKNFTVGAGDPNGWYEVLFDTSPSITALTQYCIASNFVSNYYSSTIPWPGQTVSGNLQDHSAKHNTTLGAFPATDVGNKYWTDVLFVAMTPSAGSWVQVTKQAMYRSQLW